MKESNKSLIPMYKANIEMLLEQIKTTKNPAYKAKMVGWLDTVYGKLYAAEHEDNPKVELPNLVG